MASEYGKTIPPLRMNKSVVAALLYIFSVAGVMAEPVPAVVDMFYRTMKEMSQVTDDSKAVDYRTDLMNCFKGREDGGIPVPNDFGAWGYTSEKYITANTYSTRFYDLSYRQKRLRMVDYNVEKSQPISEIELKRFKNQSQGLIQAVVRKILSDGTVTKTFTDTLIVENGKIVIFKNALYNDETNIDIEGLRALAASYYSAKQYRKAYDAYQKIIKYDPDNGNAYYRLAILLEMKYKECGYKKKPRELARDYATKALNLGVAKAEAALYYIDGTLQPI